MNGKESNKHSETLVETSFIAKYSQFLRSSKCASKAFLIYFVGAYFNNEKKLFKIVPQELKRTAMYIYLQICRCAHFCLLFLDLIYYFWFQICVQILYIFSFYFWDCTFKGEDFF